MHASDESIDTHELLRLEGDVRSFVIHTLLGR